MGALAAALALPLGVGLAAAGTDYALRPLVQEGAPAPGGGALSHFGAVQLNRHRDLLFTARVGQREGLFLLSAGRLQAIALQGAATPLGGRYLELAYMTLNDRREVAFVATIQRESSDRTAPRVAILTAALGQIPRVVVKVRDRAPGTGTYKDFRDLAFDGRGRLAFVAALSDGDWPGGLFVTSGDEPRRIAAVLDATPIGGHFREIAVPSLGPAGAVAFHATVSADGARSAIFVGLDGALAKAAASGDPSPLGGTFSRFANPVLDRQGRLYFWAAIAGGSSPAALFVRAGNHSIRTLARRGGPSPNGRRYAFLATDLAAGAGLAFQASLEGAGASIFLTDGRGVRPVVESGMAAPSGQAFTSFGAVALNGRGEIAFVGLAGGREAIYHAVPGGAR